MMSAATANKVFVYMYMYMYCTVRVSTSCMCTCVRLIVYTCMVCMYVHMYVCMYAYVCMYVCHVRLIVNVCICTFTHHTCAHIQWVPHT